MITQNSLQKTTFSSAGLELPQRIIVLVPDAEINLAHAAGRICEITSALEGTVQLIGLCADAYREPGLRRQLVTLSALIGNEKMAIRSKVEIGHNWLNALMTEWQEGDTIVCFGGVSAGPLRRPLNELLESSVRATLYVIDGLPRQERRKRPGWLSNLMAWGGSSGIILGLFWLQVEITHVPTEWARTLLLSISVFAEFGMMWFWNSLFQ